MNASTTPLLAMGLGNPGLKHGLTRHNVGHLVLDELASCASPMSSSFNVHKKSDAEIVQTRFKAPDGSERQVILAEPRTYMNLSSGPIAALAKFFNIAPTDAVVAHDELDLDPGVVRLRRGGGEDGHNGLRSASKSSDARDYMRMRIGIGRPPGRQDSADYILRDFNAKERGELALTPPTAAEAVELVANHGLEITWNQIHGQ